MGTVDGQGIRKDFDPTIRKSINTGYIVVDENEDRAAFIEQCLRTERFSIFVENGGGVLHNCYITKSALRDIQFPVEGSTLGSAVIFFAEPFSGKAVITGVVGKMDGKEFNKEDVIVWKKVKGGNYALLSIDGNGQVTVDVIGVNKSGKVNIMVRNADYSAEVNIHVKGNINLYSEGNTNLTAVGGDINITTDKALNISSDRDVIIQSEYLKVHGANEAMVKGNTLKSSLEDTNKLVDAIKDCLLNWTVIASDGGAALKAYAATKLTAKNTGSLDKINSEKSFLE